MRILARYLLIVLLLLLILIVGSYQIVRMPQVQTWFTLQAKDFLEKQLHTEISLDSAQIDIFKDITLNGLLIKDQQNDTLLYAQHAQVQVRKFALWWKIVRIKQVELENVYVNIYDIEDNRFNYSFITDYFGGSTKKEQQKEFDWLLEVRKSILHQVRASYINCSSNEKYLVDCSRLTADVEDLNIADNSFVIKNIDLRQPNIYLEKFALSEPPPTVGDDVLPSTRPEPTATKPFFLKLQHLNIQNGTFQLVKSPQQRRAPSVDFKDLAVYDFNIKLHDATVRDNELQTVVEKASLKEKSGFVVQQLSGDVLVRSDLLQLRRLHLQTPHSDLGNALTFSFSQWSDFSNFVSKVKFTANVADSRFAFSDLAFFVPSLHRPDVKRKIAAISTVNIAGQAEGKVPDFTVKNLKITTTNETRAAGDVHIRHLPDVQKMHLDLKIDDFATHLRHVAALLQPKTVLPPTVLALGNVTYQGNFKGTLKDFLVQGNFNSELGTLQSDLALNFEHVPTYKGTFIGNNFQLGTITKNNQLGLANFQAQVDGKGFKPQEMDFFIDALVTKVEFKQYGYENISVKGNFRNQIFDGTLDVKDPNLLVNFNGNLNLNNAQAPVFKFHSLLTQINLQELGFSKEPFSVSMESDFDFSGNNLDNLEGDISFSKLKIDNKKTNYELKDFKIKAQSPENGNRRVVVQSDLADANIYGAFSYRDLPIAIKQFSNRFNPYKFQTLPQIAPQTIQFDIKVKQPNELAALFYPDLKELSHIDIHGKFDSGNNTLQFDADLPRALYRDFLVDSLHLEANAQGDAFYFSSMMHSFRKATYIVPDVALSGTVQRDTLSFYLQTGNDPFNNRLVTHGELYKKTDTLRLDIPSLAIFVAGQPWQAADAALSYWGDRQLLIQDLNLRNGEQYVTLMAAPTGSITENIAALQFQNVRLEDLQILAQNTSLGLRGTASGNVSVQNYLKAPLITGSVEVNDFVLKGNEIGYIYATALKENTTKIININADVKSEAYDLTARGAYDLNTTSTNQALNIDVDVRKFKLAFFESILNKNISDTQGNLQGNLNIRSRNGKPLLNGKIFATDAQSRINYVNVAYRVAPQWIDVVDNVVYFNDITLFEGAKNTAALNGKLDLNNFKDLSVEAVITTENMLLLNTAASNNALYYGTAIGEGYIVFQGALADLYMYLYIKSHEGTQIYLPLGETGDVADANFFYFKNVADTLSKVITQQLSATNTSKMEIDIDLDLTPDAELQLIFDLQAGDIIKSRGTGQIQMDYATGRDFNIYGNYTIDQGEYLFTMQNLINKNFNIKNGSTLAFYGDPYQARLNVDALYTVRNTSLRDLLQTASIDPNSSGKSDIDINLQLRGTLEVPTVDFALQLPSSTNSSLDPTYLREVESRLTSLNNDDDPTELNLQVFGLLMLNRFMPQNIYELNNSFASSGASATVSEFLSNQLSSVISQTLNLPIDINWNRYDENSGGLVNETRNEFALTYSDSFFNDRVVIEVGGKADVGNNNSNANSENVALSGDVALMYKITKNGKYRVKLYNKSDRDAITGRFYRTGIGLYFTEDFDSVKEWLLLRSLRKEQQKAQF